ncbi:MAG: response regulator [Lachnospiraceae bacterium]|nr:response regulator [Lachnospiraceae bacterium]
MKIVIVEDENSIRNGLCNILPKLEPGYMVLGTAANGQEGLELIERTRPDVVIMDIQMPEMDGLTMLGKLREKGILSRVIVLTAYSDFSYAKRAIELNIENYLLKPIKIPELRETLRNIQAELEEEKGQEKLQERLLSLEQIFRGCILAELPIDEELKRITRERYGLDVQEPLGMFAIWLGDRYEAESEKVREIIESYTGKASDYEHCLIMSVRYQMVTVILYHMGDVEKIQKRSQAAVLPALCRGLNRAPVVSWGECQGLKELAETFASMQKEQKWNLSFEPGTLISHEKIQNTVVVPLKYPMEIETGMKKAVTGQASVEFYRLFCHFSKSCVGAGYDPDEIREACIRFCLSLLSLAKSLERISSDTSARLIVGEISQAVTWDEIWNIFMRVHGLIFLDKGRKEEPTTSSLVNKARAIIGEYYNQGITLEELAQRLCISEEYLSAQFKKETGSTFTETVRRYRIDRVKELLLHSELKLNQIADMVGYSDPKYMSKVFKEEVGMLPAEFRKQNR